MRTLVSYNDDITFAIHNIESNRNLVMKPVVVTFRVTYHPRSIDRASAHDGNCRTRLSGMGLSPESSPTCKVYGGVDIGIAPLHL